MCRDLSTGFLTVAPAGAKSPCAGRRSALRPLLPSLDFIIEGLPGDDTFIVSPRHQRASNWLMSIGEGVAVDERSLTDFLAAAVWSGFAGGLRLCTGDLVIGELEDVRKPLQTAR
jgi:hypothetical protein